MWISHKWLHRYLPDLNKFSAKEISEILTNSLAEVESYHTVRKELANVFLGEVTQTEKHPDADKLNVCKVTIDGTYEYTIVCGAPNVKPGIRVAVCLPGGRVYDAKDPSKTIEINEREVKGQKSQGMICSAKELGINDNHETVLEINDNLPLGTNLCEILIDTVYDIENKSISHRSDCFSHLGIARELSAILHIDLQETQFDEQTLVKTDDKAFSVEIKTAQDLCPRFNAIVLSNIEVKESPLWMQAYISAIGIRPINNIVDITNFVMLDKGQPLHAYDYDKLSSAKLSVRKAKSEEKVTTLDGKEYVLDNDMIVVADDDGVEDIAGIMGGNKSQITYESKTIVLEAANWNMYNIRKTSRTLALRTEASTRFEKGLDPNLTEKGINAAITLCLDLANADIASELIDIYPVVTEQKETALNINQVQRFLGIELSRNQIVEILEWLGLEIVEQGTGIETNELLSQQLLIQIPTFRQDLAIEQDILEEIARVYGYERINPRIPLRTLQPVSKNNLAELIRQCIRHLTALGFDEVRTYSFISEEMISHMRMEPKNHLKLSNPIAPEYTYIRNSLLPSLVTTAYENSKVYDKFKLLEVNRAISKATDSNGINIQPWMVSGIILTKEKSEIYYQAKNFVDSLLSKLNLKGSYQEGINSDKFPASNAMHPLKSAQIVINELEIGIVGELHPETVYKSGLNSVHVGVFELNLEALLSLYEPEAGYKSISKFPAVTRDLSFWVDSHTNYATIERQINQISNPLITDITLVDVFIPKDQDETRKGVTISLGLQSEEKTLTEDEIKQVTDQVITTLESNVKATLRGNSTTQAPG